MLFSLGTSRTKKYRRNQKAQHQGHADRTHFSAAVCIDAAGHRYKSHFCTMGDVDVILPPGTGLNVLKILVQLTLC